MSEKKKADTQKEENKKLRVAEKKGGHVKKRKWEIACRWKKKHTRKTGKKEICVSGNARDGTRVTSQERETGAKETSWFAAQIRIIRPVY